GGLRAVVRRRPGARAGTAVVAIPIRRVRDRGRRAQRRRARGRGRRGLERRDRDRRQAGDRRRVGGGQDDQGTAAGADGFALLSSAGRACRARLRRRHPPPREALRAASAALSYDRVAPPRVNPALLPPVEVTPVTTVLRVPPRGSTSPIPAG